MATGYEVDMYRDISSIARSLRAIEQRLTGPEPSSATPVSPALQRIEDRCREAGLDIMAAVMSVLYDRETVPVETLAHATVADSDIMDLYESFIAPAIDALEDSLRVEGNNS